MIRLMILSGAVVLPEQVLERHYFLEVLNRPEYIWGIRAVSVMAAVLAVFLYFKLKENAGELIMVNADASGTATDSEPISEVTSETISESNIEQVSEATSETVSEPNIEQVSEVISETSPEPDAEPTSEVISETSPEPDAEPMPEVISEASPEPDAEPTPEVISETSPEPEVISETSPEPDTESAPERKSRPKRVPSHEKEIVLLALVGISIGGLILFTCGRKRGKG